MPRTSTSVAVAAVFGFLAIGMVAVFPARESSAQDYGKQVIYLNQAWSQEDRNTFYWISQGTAMMPYDVFLNLEVSDSRDLFRSDANLKRFGLMPAPADPQWNPDALPVGVTKEVITEGRWKGAYAGINCAACHTGELSYQGKQVRIDGDVGMHFDIVAFFRAADAAVQATLKDSEKFDRMAARIGASTPDAKNDLRQRFEKSAEDVRYYTTRIMVPPHDWGPGRMDALNLILNRKLTIALKMPENWFPPLAPVKPPFLWNAPQGSWTQWSGIQQDPIARNFGETQGVYMPMDLSSKTREEGLFDSNAQLLNLQKIEGLLSRLAPPKWPEEVFGKIDRTKAAEGKKLFTQYCAGCHNSYPYTWTEPNKFGKRFIQVGIVPQSVIGTDPMQFGDFLPYVQTGQLAPYLPEPFKGSAVAPVSVVSSAASQQLLEKALSKLNLSPEDSARIHGYREFPLAPPPQHSYKAGPRDGVWAEPPYLHNASVPNLYEMLIPAAQRTKKFYVGRDFDPVKVGVDTSGKSGTFLFDTSLEGNSNAGHSFENGPRGNGVIGPLLTDEQRWALVEYLKSIPDEEGRVTPFGGPQNATTGHVKWEWPR